MNKTTILVIGDNPEILESTIQQINSQAYWVATEANTDEQAIEKFHQQNFDVVIFTGNRNTESERKLRKIFSIQNPDIIFLENSVSNNSLLTAEIVTALDKRKEEQRASFSFTDDALKNAGLNISIQ